MRRTASLFLLAVLAFAHGFPQGNWLARQQTESGAWLVDGKPDIGATGLSVLAFLGAGYTDRGSVKDNPYVAQVRRGLQYLIEHPTQDARDHAIATLALCEAYWMTKDPIYKSPAERDLAKLAGDDDPITRAFVVMALKSGRFAKLTVFEEQFARERAWLDQNAGRNPATELISRIFLSNEDPRKSEPVQHALKLLLREKPRDAMTWYFGTLGAFQIGGETWKNWNESMKDDIIKKQRRDDGGSWNGDVRDTALYICCLEVYYRYDRVFGLGGDKSGPPTMERPTRSSLPPLKSRIDLAWSDGELELETLSADVRVEGFRARVHLKLSFFYDGENQNEGTFQLRLPDGASPHTLAFGNTAKTALSADAAFAAAAPYRMKQARMVARDRARWAYRTITSERRDPALMEWDGEGVFTTRVFPLEPNKLHQVELGYDVDVPENGEFVLTLPETRRPTDVRLGGIDYHATELRRFTHKAQPTSVMIGSAYTGGRLPRDLLTDWSVESASLTGCTDVVVGSTRFAARGEAVEGATLELRLSKGTKTRTWSTSLAKPVASDLTARIYGEVAVGALEPFVQVGEGVPEAYARHFRVVRETCSLIMLESEKDYERFGIHEKDDASVVMRAAAAPWLKERRTATPKQLLAWRLKTLGKSTALLDLVPDADFVGLPSKDKSDLELARACEKLGRGRLALVYHELAGTRDREGLWTRILMTESAGPWFEQARKELGLDGHELAVVVHWNADDTDVDLHVVDPFGDVCNWRNPRTGIDGRLVRDRMQGRGPEIYRLKRAEPGEYVIRVNYFRPAGQTRAQVTAIAGRRVFRGSCELTQRDQMVEVLRVTIPKR